MKLTIEFIIVIYKDMQTLAVLLPTNIFLKRTSMAAGFFCNNRSIRKSTYTQEAGIVLRHSCHLPSGVVLSLPFTHSGSLQYTVCIHSIHIDPAGARNFGERFFFYLKTIYIPFYKYLKPKKCS